MVICLVHHQEEEGPLRCTHAAGIAKQSEKRGGINICPKNTHHTPRVSLAAAVSNETANSNTNILFLSRYSAEMDPHIMVAVVAILPMPAPGKKRPCHPPQPQSRAVAVPQVWPILPTCPQSNPPVRT